MIVDAERARRRRRATLPRPTATSGPPGEAVTLLVIHNISLPPGEFGGDGIVRLFTNDLDCSAHPYYRALAGLRVSAHFLIRRTGELLQFVPCTRRAWHAGVSTWRGRAGCNDFSIGIELEGADDVPFTEPQYRVLAELARALQARISDRRHRRPQRHRAGAQDRSRARFRLGRAFATRSHTKSRLRGVGAKLLLLALPQCAAVGKIPIAVYSARMGWRQRTLSS